MATALNMTMKLKQDPASQAKLKAMKEHFEGDIQPAIDSALRESEIVHFARVLVIDDRYIQVITEFDGDAQVYTDFFREALPDVFKAIFELVEGAPPWDELKDDPDAFFEFSGKANVKSLGKGLNSGQGFLFSAFPNLTVKQILQKVSA